MSTNPLEGLVNLLDGAAKLAKEIGAPINEVSTGFSDAENDVKEVESFIGDLNDVVTLSTTISDLCYALTEIPVVGEVLDVVGTALRDFGNTVSDIMKPINTFKRDVLDEVKRILQKINEVLSKITKYLNFFITNLPRWANTIQVLYFGWEIAKALATVLSGTEPGKRLEALVDTFDGIGKQVKSVYDAVSGGLKVVWDVIKTVLRPVWDAMKTFFGWFETVISEASKVLNVFHDVNNIVDKVEDAIKPIKWALDAVKCIFDTIFKPVLDWIMHVLGLDKLEDKIENELKDALHINDMEQKLTAAFNKDKMSGSSDKLTSSQGSISRVHELDEALKSFTSDPQQALMAALLTALSGTPVIPGSFPPPPLQPPPLDFGGGSTESMFLKPLLAVSYKPKVQILKILKIKQASMIAPGPIVNLVELPAIAAPSLPSSPTDWPDVDTFIKTIDAIIGSLVPVLTLGTQLQQYLTKAEAQVAIPGQLHEKLSALQTETQFLHDFSSFLQLFPIFKEFLPFLTNGLGEELTSIKSLDGDMTQFVDATSSLSTSLQPILKAESPTLFATITQLTSTLNNWKSQAKKYRDQIQQGYSMSQKAGGKCKAELDALAKTYHQRLAQLQSLLNQIKDLATTASSTSHNIVQYLELVSGDFDKIDPYVQKLEDDIVGVSEMASWARKLDGIFAPLECMLKTYKCVGDENNIKGTQMKAIKTIIAIASDPVVQQDFKQLFEKVLDHFFPVQSVNSLVKTGLADVQKASSTISSSSGQYLTTLTSIQMVQVGKYQFQHKNRKTGKLEIIDSHFFTDEQVQLALKVGQDLNQAA